MTGNWWLSTINEIVETLLGERGVSNFIFWLRTQGYRVVRTDDFIHVVETKGPLTRFSLRYLNQSFWVTVDTEKVAGCNIDWLLEKAVLAQVGVVWRLVGQDPH